MFVYSFRGLAHYHHGRKHGLGAVAERHPDPHSETDRDRGTEGLVLAWAFETLKLNSSDSLFQNKATPSSASPQRDDSMGAILIQTTLIEIYNILFFLFNIRNNAKSCYSNSSPNKNVLYI